MSPFQLPLNNLVFLLMLCVPAVVVLLPVYWRMCERARVLDLARKALEQGASLPPEVLQLLPERAPLPSATRDIRRGYLLIVLAFTLWSLASPITLSSFAGRSSWGVASVLHSVALLPFLLGAGMLFLGIRARRAGQP